MVSDFLHVPAVVPQGTRIGPWLFLAMINDFSIAESPSKNVWKFADDNTISEVILKDEESTLQETMNQVADWSKENKFQLNPKKCKELRINFTKQSHSYEPVRINDQCLELVKSAKILGMLITDDLKWNCHIENIVSKGPFTPTFLNRFEINSNPNEANVNSHKRSEKEFDPI